MDQEKKERSWSDPPRDILRTRVSGQSPYLISFIDDVKCKFYHPILENKYEKDFPELYLCSSRISSSNYGWLLMNAGLGFLTFFNPFTSELIDVPPIVDDQSFEIFYFSSPPTSSNCTIIAVKNFNGNSYEIGTIKHGEIEWTITRFDIDEPFMTSFCNAVFIDGRVYLMRDEFSIRIFDIKTSDWKVCDNHIVPHRKWNFYRLIGMVEDNGGMLMVYESREHQQLHITRLDLSKMTWEKVDSLGDDKVLYVSEGASYLETVAAKGMGNKIYFPKFHEGSGVFYCLTINKYYSCDGRYRSEGPYRLFQPRFCAWIKPNYFRTKVEADLGCSSSIDTKVHRYYRMFKKWAIMVDGEDCNQPKCHQNA